MGSSSPHMTAGLAPALANAALLVAAPTLGCLRTYTSVLTDLYNANGLPMPDLAPVFGYNELYTAFVPSPIISNCLGAAASNVTSIDVLNVESNHLNIFGTEFPNVSPKTNIDNQDIPEPSKRFVTSAPTAHLP